MAMTPDAASQQQNAAASNVDDVYKGLVRLHAALAERTNQEVIEIMPWTMDKLMGLIRDVNTLRKSQGGAGS